MILRPVNVFPQDPGRAGAKAPGVQSCRGGRGWLCGREPWRSGPRGRSGVIRGERRVSRASSGSEGLEALGGTIRHSYGDAMGWPAWGGAAGPVVHQPAAGREAESGPGLRAGQGGQGRGGRPLCSHRRGASLC